MSFCMLFVASDLSLPPTGTTLPKVVSHNLSREAAESLAAELSNNYVGGQRLGCEPIVSEYYEAHADTGSENCTQCQELVVEYCRRVLKRLEDEKRRRSKD